MRRAGNKSSCPINLSLEAVGDTWSLLIIRDIIFAGKRSFREFLGSPEGIASNILKTRLSALVANDILSKYPHPTDMRKDIYSLTPKGIALVPILIELADWSLTFNPSAVAIDGTALHKDKRSAIDAIQKTLVTSELGPATRV
jgi:DNA-binding HxlR family transcriptional regulator